MNDQFERDTPTRVGKTLFPALIKLDGYGTPPRVWGKL